MANYLTLTSVEAQIKQDVMPRLEMILTATPDVPPPAILGSFMQSIYENPKLLECTRESIMLAASTAGHLALRPGKVTGQLWLIPRSIKRVKMCNAELGYKALPTIAARSGRNIESGVIRAADKNIKIVMGSNPSLSYEPNLVDSDSAVIAAYSQQEMNGRRFSLKVVPVKYCLAIKNKNSKASSAQGFTDDGEEKSSFSPWNNLEIGFPAMCEKTATLLQRRNIPWGMFHYAAALNDQHDMGRPAWIATNESSGQPEIIDGEGHHSPIQEVMQPAPVEEDLAPELTRVDFTLARGGGKVATFSTAQEWANRYIADLRSIQSADGIRACTRANNAKLLEIREAGYVAEANAVQNVINEKS